MKGVLPLLASIPSSMVTLFLCLDVQKRFLSHSIHGAKPERLCSLAGILLCTTFVENCLLKSSLYATANSVSNVH
jgi:hypothetical protein